MDTGRAYDVVQLWARAVADRAAGAQYPVAATSIANALSALIPNSTDSLAAVSRDEDPRMMIGQGGLLFLVAVTAHDSESPPVSCQLVTLEPSSARLSVTQDWFQVAEGPVSVGGVRRIWTLTVDGMPSLEFEGLDHITGFDKGPNEAERLGRAIAHHLGWVLPTR